MGVIHWCIGKVEPQSPVCATQTKKASRSETPRVELIFLSRKLDEVAFGGVSAASLLLPQATEPFPSQRGACSFVPALRFECEGICKSPRISSLVGRISTKTLERDVDPISLIGEPFEASARGGCSTEALSLIRSSHDDPSSWETGFWSMCSQSNVQRLSSLYEHGMLQLSFVLP